MVTTESILIIYANVIPTYGITGAVVSISQKIACIIEFVYVPQKYTPGSHGSARYAALIIAYRSLRGVFFSMDDLKD